MFGYTETSWISEGLSRIDGMFGYSTRRNERKRVGLNLHMTCKGKFLSILAQSPSHPE
jgi:hypothetical protein